MSLRELIETQIKVNRDKLSASSMKTYVSTLFNLHKKIGSTDDSLEFFTHSAEILKYLEQKPASTRKTILSALFVLTGDDAYRTLMLTDCKEVNATYKLQKKDTKQQENWIELPAVKEIYDGYLANVKAIFANKLPMDYATIVNFFLLAFLGAGVSGIVPRRSLDYCLLKIKNYDVERDNYLKSDKMTFNIYKTAKVYGEQFVNIPKELMPLVKKWVKVNPTDYFYFQATRSPLQACKLTRC